MFIFFISWATFDNIYKTELKLEERQWKHITRLSVLLQKLSICVRVTRKISSTQYNFLGLPAASIGWMAKKPTFRGPSSSSTSGYFSTRLVAREDFVILGRRESSRSYIFCTPCDLFIFILVMTVGYVLFHHSMHNVRQSACSHFWTLCQILVECV
jgi:hypothetical protein